MAFWVNNHAVVMFGLALVAAAGMALSAVLTAGVHRYALQSGLLDHANARSSHAGSIPRGGGLAVVIVSLLSVVPAMAVVGLEVGTGVAILVGGLLVAGVGFLDDRRSLPIWPRLLVHLSAAAIVTWTLAPAKIDLGIVALDGWPALLLVWLTVAWCINLYNFMDGIDGLAGAQLTLTTAAIAAIGLIWARPDLGLLAAASAGAGIGFLRHNWAPARIFMGDVGSGFCGLWLGVLLLLAVDAGLEPLAAALLLAPFWIDASLTLSLRMARGERWYTAHREHAYQRLVRCGVGHDRVTACYIVLNVALWPIAGYVQRQASTTAFVVTVMVLAALWGGVQWRCRSRSGLQEPNENKP